MDELKGRVAIVTGAASGIGRSVAELFAREGAAGLTLADIQAPPLHDLASNLRKRCGCDLLVSETDVSDPDQADRMVQATVKRFGRIDILVNNAGICPMVPWDRTTLESWNRMLSVNLTSAFLCSKAVLPHMRKRKFGRLVHISSVGAFVGSVTGHVGYGVSKAGVGRAVQVPGQAVWLRGHPLQRHCAGKHRHSSFRSLRGGKPADVRGGFAGEAPGKPDGNRRGGPVPGRSPVELRDGFDHARQRRLAPDLTSKREGRRNAFKGGRPRYRRFSPRPDTRKASPMAHNPEWVLDPKHFPVWQAPDGSRRVNLLVSPETCGAGDISAGLFWLHPGHETQADIHPESAEIYYVVSGRGKLVMDGQEFRVEKGMTVYIPAGVEHQSFNDGHQDLCYFYALRSTAAGSQQAGGPGLEPDRLPVEGLREIGPAFRF